MLRWSTTHIHEHVSRRRPQLWRRHEGGQPPAAELPHPPPPRGLQGRPHRPHGLQPTLVGGLASERAARGVLRQLLAPLGSRPFWLPPLLLCLLLQRVLLLLLQRPPLLLLLLLLQRPLLLLLLFLTAVSLEHIRITACLACSRRLYFTVMPGHNMSGWRRRSEGQLTAAGTAVGSRLPAALTHWRSPAHTRSFCSSCCFSCRRSCSSIHVRGGAVEGRILQSVRLGGGGVGGGGRG